MSDQPTSPTPPPDPPRPNINIEAGRDLNAGTFVGGNMTTSTTTTTNTNVGFNAAQVQRLIVTVAMLIFVTAGCFFSGGLVLGVGAIAALNSQNFTSSEAAASRFQSNLEQLRTLTPGQPFEFPFNEDEISSYVKFILGDQIGFVPETGRARLLTRGVLVVGGELASLGNIPVAATFELTNEIGAPLRLKAAAVQILRLGDLPFGWVGVPTIFLQDLERSVNSLFGAIELQGVTDQSNGTAKAWSVVGVSH